MRFCIVVTYKIYKSHINKINLHADREYTPNDKYSIPHRLIITTNLYSTFGFV